MAIGTRGEAGFGTARCTGTRSRLSRPTSTGTRCTAAVAVVGRVGVALPARAGEAVGAAPALEGGRGTFVVVSMGLAAITVTPLAPSQSGPHVSAAASTTACPNSWALAYRWAGSVA